MTPASPGIDADLKRGAKLVNANSPLLLDRIAAAA